MNLTAIFMRPTTCYVYITRRRTGLWTDYRIGYSVNESRALNPAEGEGIVYLRSFSDPVDALGHKLLLEQLSAASLRRLIRKYNINHKTDLP